MLKQTAKRGFTITELVIVIVVIAILAAVLIPTFASLIKKANQSADVQLTKNLNTILAMDEAENGKATEFETVLHAFQENGYLLANLNPTAKGCYLVWESETNQMLLVELTDKAPNYKVLYNAKKDFGEPDDSWYFAVKDQAAKDAVKAALPAVNVEMTILDTTTLNSEINKAGENTVYVDGSVVVDDNNTIKLDNASAVTTIDLGSNKVTGGSKNAAAEAFPFYVTAGTLNLKNGTVQATAEWYDADGDLVKSAIVAANGVANIDSTTFDCPNGEILIAYAGANGTIKNATINAFSAINVGGGSNVTVESCTVNVFCEAIWVSNSGGYDSKVTVKGGTYSGTGNTVAMYGGTLVIEDGEFKSTQTNLFKFYNTGSVITIKGGTFNGIKAADLTAENVKAMFSTGSTNYAGITVTRNADGSVTIAN